MADGNAKEMVAVMGDGNCDSNGKRQWQQQSATATATTMATEAKMAMATVRGTAIAMAAATAMGIMTKGGLPLHVPAMCSTMAGALVGNVDIFYVAKS